MTSFVHTLHQNILRFVNNKKSIATFLFVAFVGLGLSGLHGFSLPIWREILDGIEAKNSPELLTGRVRVVRADDWRVALTAAIAQTKASPKFPLINERISSGQNMLVVNGAPVLDFASVFRPSSWGYFLSSDTGVSWFWWVRFFGAFLGCYLLLAQIPYVSSLFALAGASIFICSPFMQYWSFNSGDIFGFSSLLWFSVLKAIRSSTLKSNLVWGTLAGWSAGCLALTLYPPLIVVVTYAHIAIFTSIYVIKHGGLTGLGFLRRRAQRILIAAATAVIVLTIGIMFFWDGASSSILKTMNSVYPGSRLALGNDLSALHVFGNHALYNQSYDYHRNIGGNICESAGFLLFYPLLIGLWLLELVYSPAKRRQLAVFLPVVIMITLLHCWVFVGSPVWLAQVTGMKLVPGNRAIFGLGILDLFLLIGSLNSFLKGRDCGSNSTILVRMRLILLGGWLGFGFYVFYGISKIAPAFAVQEFAWRYGFFVLLSSLIVLGKSRSACALLLLASFVSTYWFNPRVKGGTEILQNNSLTSLMAQATTEEEDGELWLIFAANPVVLDAPKASGFNVLGGAYITPNRDFWRLFDPTGTNDFIYNRFSLVTVRILPKGSSLKWTLINQSEFKLEIPADFPRRSSLKLKRAVSQVGDTKTANILEQANWRIITQNSNWIVWTFNH